MTTEAGAVGVRDPSPSVSNAPPHSCLRSPPTANASQGSRLLLQLIDTRKGRAPVARTCTACNYTFYTHAQWVYHMEYTRYGWGENDDMCHAAEAVPILERNCLSQPLGHFIPRRMVWCLVWSQRDSRVMWGRANVLGEPPRRFAIADPLAVPVTGTLGSSYKRLNLKLRYFMANELTARKTRVTLQQLVLGFHQSWDANLQPRTRPHAPPRSDIDAAQWLLPWGEWPDEIRMVVGPRPGERDFRGIEVMFESRDEFFDDQLPEPAPVRGVAVVGGVAGGVGDAVGEAMGDGVGDGVGDAVEEGVSDAVGDVVGDGVGDGVADEGGGPGVVGGVARVATAASPPGDNSRGRRKRNRPSGQP